MKHIPIIGVAGASSSNKYLKAIALLLVLCIADVYVLADARRPNASDKDVAADIAPSKILLGRLFVPYPQEILVNGSRAGAGDIILSGSLLQTPNLLRPATVDIGSIAKLYIEAETDLLLTFDQRSVEVRVLAGNAVLNTSYEVKGQMIMPDGQVCPSMHDAPQKTPQTPSSQRPPAPPSQPPQPPPSQPPPSQPPHHPTWLEALLAAIAAAEGGFVLRCKRFTIASLIDIQGFELECHKGLF